MSAGPRHTRNRSDVGRCTKICLVTCWERCRDEQSRIEQELAQDPQLPPELEHLRRCLRPGLETVSAAADVDPPRAGRPVCEAIDTQVALGEHHATQSAGSAAAADIRLQRYSVSDTIVLSLVVLAAFSLILPALANSRFQARTACQDNLRVLGEGLFTYSERDPVLPAGPVVRQPIVCRRVPRSCSNMR